MPATIAQKFRIKEGTTLYVLHAPAGFREQLEPLPAGVRIIKNPSQATQIHWFVQSRAQLESELMEVLPMVKGDIVCWIYYPKGTSGIQTDLTRDKGWDKLLEHDMQWISLVSFNDTWSAFGMRFKQTGNSKKASKPDSERPILQYIDPAKKTVRIPDDLETALRKNKDEEAYFHSLAYSHRKEYVEWIVSAKKEETRKGRVEKTIELLKKKAKNPND